jgi:hypothetical protein
MKYACGMQFGVVAARTVARGSSILGGMRVTRALAHLILLILCGSTLAHANSPSISSYMNCARAFGVAINDKFAILPGERSGDKGLYVYTDQSAYFLLLGAPHSEVGEAHEFFLRTNVSDVGDIFLTFRDKKPGSRSNIQPAIGYQTTAPSKNDLGNYRFTPAYDSLGDHARNIISNILKEKVASVKDFIDNKNSFSTPEEAKVAFEKDRVIYREKLERCRIDGDRILKFLVAEETQKLESGFPGVTIWETQIGGKLSTSQVR